MIGAEVGTASTAANVAQRLEDTACMKTFLSYAVVALLARK